jgi:hypothetical protein
MRLPDETRARAKRILGDPVTFYQRNFQRSWWVSVIQSYAHLRIALRGEGLHQHHLIPKTLLLHGPTIVKGLVDYVPSIPFTETEHLSTLHSSLNDLLRTGGLWRRTHYSADDLERAMDLLAQFYRHHGLTHFAAAVRGFRQKAYNPMLSIGVSRRKRR